MGAFSFGSTRMLKTFKQTALVHKNLATREPTRGDWPLGITDQALGLQKSLQTFLVPSHISASLTHLGLNFAHLPQKL